MKAIFVRSKDDQTVIKLTPDDNNETILLEEFVEDAGKKAVIDVQGDKTVLLYPKDPK